jgi:hypothetical protein
MKAFFITRDNSVAIRIDDIAFAELIGESETPLVNVWLQSDGGEDSIELTAVEDIADFITALRAYGQETSG